jgi:cytochrome c biogenesis protein CcdA
MVEFCVTSGLAFWLGILTSISPCPLATNIAAISFIGRHVDNPRRVLFGGLLYTLGRASTYLIIGILLVSSLLSAPYLSLFLQKYMNKILGPLFILVGMFMLELIELNLGSHGWSEKLTNRAQKWGLWGSAIMGIIFALTFCPLSAALFFGSLIPLSVKYDSGFFLPFVYGLGTALPVFFFAVALALGTRSIAKAFQRVTAAERWVRRVTGGIFIVIGIYFSLAYIFRVVPG